MVQAISGEKVDDEFGSITRLSRLTGAPVHRAVEGLRQKDIRHRRSISTEAMRDTVLDILQNIS